MKKDNKKVEIVKIYSKVILKGKNGQLIIKIVRPEEINIHKLYVSTSSPFGLALLNKKTGDKISVKTPKSTLKYKIISVV